MPHRRPVFIRAYGGPIHSAFYSAVDGRFWVPAETAGIIGHEVLMIDTALARQLFTCADAPGPDDGGLCPIAGPGVQLALLPGARIEFTSVIDVEPWATILAGERAVVARWNAPETGEVILLLEHYHPGLEANEFWLVPHHQDETLSAIKVLVKGRPELLLNPLVTIGAPEVSTSQELIVNNG